MPAPSCLLLPRNEIKARAGSADERGDVRLLFRQPRKDHLQAFESLAVQRPCMTAASSAGAPPMIGARGVDERATWLSSAAS